MFQVNPRRRSAPFYRFVQLTALAAAILLCYQFAIAAISFTTAVSAQQNFDGIGTTATAALPADFKVDRNTTTIRTPGTYSAAGGNTTAVGGNSLATNASNGIYNFGAGPAATATDRAIGFVASGTNTASGNLYGQFVNNSGQALTGLQVAYNVEKYRNGINVAGFCIQMHYSFDGTTWTNAGSDFKTQFAADSGTNTGFASAPGLTVNVNKVLGVSVSNGATVYLAWNYAVCTGSTVTNAQALAIDDISVLGVVGLSGTGAATPAALLSGADTVLTVNVTPASAPNSTGITVSGNLSAIGGSASQQFFDDGVNGGDQTANDNIFTYTATVTAIPGAKSIPVSISDAQARTSGTTIGLTVEEPPPPMVNLHDLQGPGTLSPYNGTKLQTTGIVTAKKTNGFFIQNRDTDADGDSNTSEGVFVFTSGAPPAAAALGNDVLVTGTVQEFVPGADPVSPSVTELSSITSVTLLSSGNPLPTPFELTVANTYPTSDLNHLEPLEGMRVFVASLTAVSPTDGNVTEPSAIGVSDGVFYAVVTGVPRPFREPGVEAPLPFPAGAPANVPRFDANPEKLRVDSDGQVGVDKLEVTSGAIVTNVTGVFDYGFRSFTILPDAVPTVAGNITAVPVPNATADEFTVASFNMERFFDTVNDAGISDVALTPTAFNNRLNKASLAIRNVLRTPDVVAVQEMENLSTLEKVANKINADAVAAGDPNPQYQAYLEEGNDPGGIDVGFLVKSSRVTVNSVMQFGKDATYINPVDQESALLNDRPPLLLRATVSRPHAPDFKVTVINNHLRSLNGVEDADGRVREKRRAQAEYLATLINAEQSNPGTNLISVGDYNALSVNDGYGDSMGTIIGNPTPADEVTLASEDLVDPNLIDLATTLPAAQQYSYVFEGNAQELDHAVVNNTLYGSLSRFAIARVNADFPESRRGDALSPERLSDHDPSVSYFNLPAQDFTAPSITLTSPANATYLLGTPLTADYSCEDESGIATCEGPVADGAAVSTATIGSFTFTVNAVDVWGNSAQAITTYKVGYGICSLMNSAQPANSGSTIPVKLQICDANGNNLSNSGTAVNVVNITGADDATYAAVGSGKANPQGLFRYDASLSGYIFNLNTKDVPAGSYLLNFQVAGDSTVHSLAIILK